MDTAARFEPRPNGIDIPGLTDEILKRLPGPYNLIAEWARYVPLDELFIYSFFALAMTRRQSDGTTLLLWGDRLVPALRVPTDLCERTRAHIRVTCKRQIMEHGSTNMFADLVTYKPIRLEDFQRAVFVAIGQRE